MSKYAIPATLPGLPVAHVRPAGSARHARVQRGILFVLGAIALIVLAARGARAQAPVAVAALREIARVECDSIARRPRVIPMDSAAAAQLPANPCSASASAPAPTIAPKPNRSVLPYVFVGALGAGLAANRFAHLDADPGGYTDTWTNKATYPKKIVHGTIAFALTTMGVDLKMRPMTSAATVCASGVAYEFTQGYVSKLDIGADCIGATAAAMWRKWVAAH